LILGRNTWDFFFTARKLFDSKGFNFEGLKMLFARILIFIFQAVMGWLGFVLSVKLSAMFLNWIGYGI
jgi:hypothetical protein